MRTLRASFASRLGRGFSSQPAAPGSRLAALRDVLEADGESSWTDDAFAVATQPAPEKRRRKQHTPHPPWLHVPKPGGADFQRIRSGLRKSKLATVCEEARCPNIGECWGGRKGTATATIMVMGDTCTRGCRFCNVKTSRTPPPIAADEPEQTADQIATWGVDYVVITSVDRDDLPDGGSSHFARVVRRVKEVRPDMRLECLTPDFNNTSGLAGVAEVATSGLDVYAHNIETVPRLQASVRDRRANWADSLKVLEHAKVARPGLVTKTSIMLGLGEEPDEVRQAMRDCLNAGVEIFTLGQYLRPSKRHLKVKRMLPPAEYDAYRDEGMAMGFRYVASGPLVRSSYKAGEVFLEAFLKQRDEQKAAQREGIWAPASAQSGGACPL